MRFTCSIEQKKVYLPAMVEWIKMKKYPKNWDQIKLIAIEIVSFAEQMENRLRLDNSSFFSFFPVLKLFVDPLGKHLG